MTLLFSPVGDSLIAGTGSTTPSTDSVGAVLGRQWLPGATTIVDGWPGRTVQQLQTVMATPGNASGNFSAMLAFVIAGTNNALGDTALTTADMDALKALLVNTGFTGAHGAIVWATIPPWVGWVQPIADVVNAWVKTQPWWVDLASTPEWALVSGGSAYDGTYRNAVTNAGHGTTLGYACWARDAAPTILRAAHSIGWG